MFAWPTLGKSILARSILVFRLLVPTKVTRFSIQGLLTWGRGILTSAILALRYRVPTLLLPRESATGLSVFAGDVDHDC